MQIHPLPSIKNLVIENGRSSALFIQDWSDLQSKGKVQSAMNTTF